MAPMILIFAIVGGVAGWGSWIVADRLTRPARAEAEASRSFLLLASLAGGGVLAGAAHEFGSESATLTGIAIVMIPILVTLLTDALAKLVFPVVVVPGALAALAIAALGPLGFGAALTAGAIAAGVTALFVIAARFVWFEAGEIPLGSGDVLIAALIGTIFGPGRTLPVLLAGVFLGGGVAALLLVSRRARGEDAIPYGVFLCLAALIALAR